MLGKPPPKLSPNSRKASIADNVLTVSLVLNMELEHDDKKKGEEEEDKDADDMDKNELFERILHVSI